MKIKNIGKDKHGMPTVNGRKAVTFRMTPKSNLRYEMNERVDFHQMASEIVKKAGLNSKIKFIIASDGVERTAMERFVSESGISSITYFPGYLTTEEMVEFLSASDIYVSSSIADAGLAASTAEAMSIRLPVIVADNADNRYWVNEAKAGLLFANQDNQSLADNILQLGNNEFLRKRQFSHIPQSWIMPVNQTYFGG